MMLLNDARKYVKEFDWVIVPVTHSPEPKSVALQRWRQYQTVKPDAAAYGRWFSQPRDGLAVVCGAVSGGLTARDFDTIPAYDRWAASHPDLAATLPTVATGRGRHVYIRSNFDGIVKVKHGGIEEGELRGKGICVLPPSVHPSGPPYRWLIQPYPNIPRLDPVAVGLVPELPAVTEEDRGAQNEDGRELKRTERDSAAPYGAKSDPSSFDSTTLESINRAIAASIPTGEGQRHWQVFKLCRSLKGIPELADLRAGALREVVRLWHTQAVEVIKTKSFDETWSDFVDGWPRVKFARGVVMADIMKRAKQSLPPEASKYDSEPVRLLVSLCCELQAHAGREPFFLSARMAAEVLAVTPMQANRWMRMLQADDVLELAQAGTKSGRAARYRYMGEEVFK